MNVLDGRVVIVTGAARGLGRVMSIGLIEAGARVAGVDLPGQAELREVAAACGPAFTPIEARLTDPDDCERVVARTLEQYGAVHVLVNNAGVGMQFINPRFATAPTRFWELTPAQYRDVMETNATTQFLMARAVAPRLVRGRWGRIVNVTTSYATMLLPGFVPYGPSKAAAEAATAIMAKDLAGSGVTVNALLPGGAADTRMITDAAMFPDRSKLVAPEKMVAPVVWLASSASDGVTGRRFVAADWDSALDPGAAATLASAPVAW
jgi:NAD(P)-dependent dehydrogenase (short-subunit alcohol dehydrogenase family)